LTLPRNKNRQVVSVETLAGDASARTYYRIRYSSGSTAVVMRLPGLAPNEGASFLDVQSYLEDLGLPVPEIYGHQPAECLLLLEDLGDLLLETAVQEASPDSIKDLYREAVDLLVEMRRRSAASSVDCVALYLAFDEKKLMEEMRFFMDHFVRGLCASEPSPAAVSDLGDFFSRICSILAAEPRIFTHRDYHARNLLIHRGRLFMIDFQDARMGPAQYDLASLLRDSYVTLPEDLVVELLGRYMDATEVNAAESRSRFRYIFHVMSLQRNIKALGTFGFQAAVKGAGRYLSSIPRTGAYIGRTIGLHGDLERFRSVVEDFIVGPAASVAG